MINIPTNLCPKIIANWIEKQSKYAKFLIAMLLFFFIAIATNVIKIEATLVTKFGIEKSYQYLNSKFKKGETWLFFILTTASQMFAFSLATMHKIFNFEILWRKFKKTRNR